MPPPAPVLMEELAEEFLRRIPPDDPASLVRAALVCKLWFRIVSGPGFRRRFREFHRTPPMLGVCYTIYDGPKDEEIARFASTTSFSPPRGIRRYWRALDSRHGRVLLHSENWNDGPFVIWDPITDEKQVLPNSPGFRDLSTWNAVVFCAAAIKCDHLDCQRGAFKVVAAHTTPVEMFVYVYSSEVGLWSQVSTANPDGQILSSEPCIPGALVGNAIYFSCFFHKSILKYGLETQEITLIDGPRSKFKGLSLLMSNEDGKLGVAYVLNFKLHIWSREVGLNTDARWTRSRVIDLATLPPLSTLSCAPHAIGSAQGIILLYSLDGLFIINLKSVKVIKLFEERYITNSVIPFMSFYTPAPGMACTEQVSIAGTSSTQTALSC